MEIDRRSALAEARLYGILDLSYVSEDRLRKVTESMLRGGVQLLQIRAKNHLSATVELLAKDLRVLCHEHRVPLILNDHPHLVAPAGAEGTHVGQDDIEVSVARETTGPGTLIGKSTHSLTQAVAAEAEGADYIGFGPLFATPTKPDYVPIGTREIQEVHRLVKLPIFCIGGIKRENLAAVIAAGARRVVVVSGILLAGDVEGYCRDCRSELERAPLP